MTIATAMYQRNVQALSYPQDQSPATPVAKDSPLDWATPTSVVGIVQWLSKLTTSDVAQVGDLMVNGREHAVLAQQVPLAK